MSKIVKLMRQGKQVEVRVNDVIMDYAGDLSAVAPGMLATVINTGKNEEYDEYYVVIDYSKYLDHNFSIQSREWLNPKTKAYDMTAKEAGFWPKDNKETIFLNSFDEIDKIFSVIDKERLSLYDKWEAENTEKTYIEWLEDIVINSTKEA